MFSMTIMIGRLTRDPEIRYTQENLMCANYTVAVDRITRQGEEKKADFFPCVAYGKQAEAAQKYMFKGQLVSITGRMRKDEWMDKEGNKRETWKTIVERQIFLQWRDGQQTENGHGQQAHGGYGYNMQAQGGYYPQAQTQTQAQAQAQAQAQGYGAYQSQYQQGQYYGQGGYNYGQPQFGYAPQMQHQQPQPALAQAQPPMANTQGSQFTDLTDADGELPF